MTNITAAAKAFNQILYFYVWSWLFFAALHAN